MSRLGPKRCSWVVEANRLYHDEEWGVPVHDDQKLFEMLVLESFQAGLSWNLILRKREAFRECFYGFDPERVARMTTSEGHALMHRSDLVRHLGKIESARHNARSFLALQERWGSFDAYLWRFTEGKTLSPGWMDQGPASTPLSHTLARDLKKAGMRFFGPVIAFAYVQAVGVVNGHQRDCWRYQAL